MSSEEKSGLRSQTEQDTSTQSVNSSLLDCEINDTDVATVCRDRKHCPPDGGWGWCVVLGCWIMHFLLGGFSRSFGLSYVEMRERFGSSAAVTSAVGGVNVGLRFFLGPLASILCIRFSARSTVFWGSILFGISTILCAYVPNIYWMILTYSIGTGVAGTLLYSPGLILVNQYFDRRRGIAIGISSSGSGIGVLIFPPLMDLLFSFYGFSGTFLILSAVMLNNCISAVFYVPLEPKQKKVATTVVKCQEKPLEDVKNDRESALKRSHVLEAISYESLQEITKVEVKFKENVVKKPESWWKSLGLKNFKNLYFVSFTVSLTLVTLAYVSSQQLVLDYGRDVGIEEGKAVFLLSIIGICDTCGRLIAGFSADIPKIKTYRTFWYCLMTLGSGAMILATAVSESYRSLAAVSALHGLFNGAVVSLRSVILTDVVGVEAMPSCLGLCVASQGIGVLVGPVFAGLLKDATGVYTYSFVMAGTCGVLGAMLLFSSTLYGHITQRRTSSSKGLPS